jgi:hypothetical protein
MNNTCPVCGEKTSGKPVKGVHFCAQDRRIAQLYLQTDEGKSGKYLRTGGFVAVLKRIAPTIKAEVSKQKQ